MSWRLSDKELAFNQKVLLTKLPLRDERQVDQIFEELVNHCTTHLRSMHFREVVLCLPEAAWTVELQPCQAHQRCRRLLPLSITHMHSHHVVVKSWRRERQRPIQSALQRWHSTSLLRYGKRPHHLYNHGHLRLNPVQFLPLRVLQTRCCGGRLNPAQFLPRPRPLQTRCCGNRKR